MPVRSGRQDGGDDLRATSSPGRPCSRRPRAGGGRRSGAYARPASRPGASTGSASAGGGARVVDVGDAARRSAPPSSTSSRDGGLGRGGRERRVDAALEPLARLGRQPVAAGGAGDRRPARSAPTRAGSTSSPAVTSVGAAAHDAGERDRAAVVGDEQVLGVERAVLPVEGGEPLPRLRPSHDDVAGAARRGRTRAAAGRARACTWLVTSTASEIGRMPARASRRCSQAGDGADGSRPRTTRAT